MTYAVQTYQLTKAFKGKEAVTGVSMKVKKGEIYGFLGPNGAGKTTVLKLLCKLLKPTAGEIELFGAKHLDHSCEFLKRMGVVVEYPAFYEKLTARDNLKLHLEYMGYHDERAVAQSLKKVHLQDTGEKIVKEFSQGMKQRLGIARAIATRPELLLLDEPINGLDPIGIAEMRELLKMLSREYGTTILLSSHILAEIEQLADTIGVINRGKLVEEVSLKKIRENGAEYIEVQTDDAEKTAIILTDSLFITNFKVFDQNIFRVYDLRYSLTVISKELIRGNVNILGISRKSGTLESHFINLLNGGDLGA